MAAASHGTVDFCGFGVGALAICSQEIIKQLGGWFLRGTHIVVSACLPVSGVPGADGQLVQHT